MPNRPSGKATHSRVHVARLHGANRCSSITTRTYPHTPTADPNYIPRRLRGLGHMTSQQALLGRVDRVRWWLGSTDAWPAGGGWRARSASRQSASLQFRCSIRWAARHREHGGDGAEPLLTEREEKSSVAIASNESFGGWTKTFTDPRLCSAIVDRLTFGGHIIETGTQSYRLTRTAQAAGHTARPKDPTQQQALQPQP